MEKLKHLRLCLGEEPGGGGGPGTPLFLDQTEARTAEKNFWRRRPPLLSQDLDDRPLPLLPPLSEGLDPLLLFTLSR